MALKSLGGGSSLDTVISDMNTNILELRQLQKSAGTRTVVKSGLGVGSAVLGSTVNIDINHNLGYQPDEAIITFNRTTLPVMLDVGLATPLTFQTYFAYTVDATKLRIILTLSNSSTYAGLMSFPYQLVKWN